LWKLPIVYVITNNRLGMGTSVEDAAAEPDLYKRGSSYRIPGTRIDGHDPVVVRDAALAALEQARVERQPVILEIMMYRLRGHSVVDPARYRSKEDNEVAQANDPVPAYRNTLLKSKVLDEKSADAIHDVAEKIVDAAVEFADSSPYPEIAGMFSRVYATPVPNMPDRLPGDPVVVMS
ncbi:MAG: thiamine pyrophosphate-dependent enzyme, partial [Terrimesophilobacter sp.]